MLKNYIVCKMIADAVLVGAVGMAVAFTDGVSVRSGSTLASMLFEPEVQIGMMVLPVKSALSQNVEMIFVACFPPDGVTRKHGIIAIRLPPNRRTEARSTAFHRLAPSVCFCD